MSIYLALTKKKKKFFNWSNCRFKRRGNLEPRGSIEPRVNFPETLPSPSPPFFYPPPLFLSFSYLCHALIVIKGEVVFCNLGL